MGTDDTFHKAFMADALYRPTPEDVRCNKCGTRLKAYYCEGRLYAVKCGYCESITLVKASSPSEAALYVGRRPEDIPKKREAKTLKRKYYRKCGYCGDRYEQSEMLRTNQSPNGWICFDCWGKAKAPWEE